MADFHCSFIYVIPDGDAGIPFDIINVTPILEARILYHLTRVHVLDMLGIFDPIGYVCPLLTALKKQIITLVVWINS